MATSTDLKDTDVICGRGLHARNHPGNHRLTEQITKYYEGYAIGSKSEKIDIIKSILQYLAQVSCRFVKKRSGKWLQIDERSAREKVGQMLREMYTQSKAPPEVHSSDNHLQLGTLALVQEHVYQELVKMDAASGSITTRSTVTGLRDRTASTDSTIDTRGLEWSGHGSTSASAGLEWSGHGSIQSMDLG